MRPSGTAQKNLVVDDDRTILEIPGHLLRTAGYEVCRRMRDPGADGFLPQPFTGGARPAAVDAELASERAAATASPAGRA